MDLSLEGLKEYLSSLLLSLLKALWYPIDSIFYNIWSLLVYFYDVIISFLQALYGLLAAIKSYVFASISFLPSPWVALLLTMVVCVMSFSRVSHSGVFFTPVMVIVMFGMVLVLL